MRTQPLEHFKTQAFRYSGVSSFVVPGVWSSFQFCLEVGSNGFGWLQDLYRNRASVAVAWATNPVQEATSAVGRPGQLESGKGGMVEPSEERTEGVEPPPLPGEEEDLIQTQPAPSAVPVAAPSGSTQE